MLWVGEIDLLFLGRVRRSSRMERCRGIEVGSKFFKCRLGWGLCVYVYDNGYGNKSLFYMFGKELFLG